MSAHSKKTVEIDDIIIKNSVSDGSVAPESTRSASTSIDTEEMSSHVPVKASVKTQQVDTYQRPFPAHFAKKSTPALQASNPFRPVVTFHLPNAMEGHPYTGKLEGKEQTGKSVIIKNPKNLEQLGLSYDSVSGLITGTPLMAGNHNIAIQWTLDNNETYSDQVLLIVNPDPKNLWKKIDPPTDDPYFKDNTASQWICCGDYTLVAASHRGRSHEHSGTFRDDDFYIAHDLKTKWSIMIVADGAGSAQYSRWGAKLMTESFGNYLMDALSGELSSILRQHIKDWPLKPGSASKALGTRFHYLFHKAGIAAVKTVEIEAKAKHATPRDYATTLLAAVVYKEDKDLFLATFWMGDGAIGVYGPKTKVRLMGSPDGGEFAGQTRFLERSALSDALFAKRVGLGYFADVEAVILMTDGVSDPIFETDNGLLNAKKWDALWDDILPILKHEDSPNTLINWLNFFTPGHHDDRTIAILYLGK